ncbi:MAG TPA: hypothetical protein VIK61_01630 [Acidimicrobiia bacterium]
MGMRRILVLVVVVLAGCSHGSHSSSQTTAWNGEGTRLNADYICRRYVPGHLVSSWVTSVADFRKTTIGTRGPAQIHRFPKLPPTNAAAWCWTGKPGAYNVYEVASDGEVQQVVSNMNGVAPENAHGAPSVP